MQNVLIIGATSAIAEAVARRYAARGAALFLVARRSERLAAIADDLRVRGARATHLRWTSTIWPPTPSCWRRPGRR